MEYLELSLEQRRQFIDVQQVFEAWRSTDREYRHSYQGSMRWITRNGTDYLHRRVHKTEKSLGRRSQQTEEIATDFAAKRLQLGQRRLKLADRLRSMQPVNRALNLARVPLVAAKILRVLDGAGLLGKQLFVAGTHALFAYEAKAGVMLDRSVVATADVDLLWDVRRTLSVAFTDIRRDGIIGLIRKADRSFVPVGPQSFRAVNDDGYYVDLICPENADLVAPSPRLGESADELSGAPIIGLDWLINSPKIEQIVMGQDGLPLLMACIDPRAFALHKAWLARRADRDPVKRHRDAEQSRIVADLAARYFNMAYDGQTLSSLPQELRDLAAGFPAPALAD